jgi:hypothetical protein
MKNMKQVIKNITVLKKEMLSEDPKFKRHLYLAYQWIKRKDLTKAENPEKTRQCIRVNLLIELINFFSKEKVNSREIYDHLTKNNFKIKTLSLDHYEMRDWFNSTKLRTTIFNNYIFVRLLPNYPKLAERGVQFIVNGLFRNACINPEIIMNENDKGFILNFKSKKGSCLSLTIPEGFKYTDPVLFNYVLINSVQSSGCFKFSLSKNWWHHRENKVFNSMIDELLQEEQDGVKNDN